MARPRVFIVDDDPDVAEILSASLPKAEFDIEVMNRPAQALERATTLPPSLALLDIDMPEMNGFELRDKLRAMPGLAQLPIIFISGADVPQEVEIARTIGADRLLIKPVPRVELCRDVRAALGLVRTESGALPALLDPILFKVSEHAETGILTASRAGVSKRVIFQEGKIVFVSSSDPRDLIGQALLRTGLITEADLLEAFAAVDVEPPRLKSALTAMRKITPEQSQKVFESKIRESVLDLFLWNDGAVRYVAGGVDDAEMPFPLSLAIQPIRIEGMKRRRRWVEVRALFPDAEASFERTGEWPAGFPRSSGDKLLGEAIERGDSLGAILLAFRGQDYAISVRLADLVRRGTLAVAPPKGFAPAPTPVLEAPIDPVSEIPSGEFPRAAAAEPPPPSEVPPAPAEVPPASADAPLASAEAPPASAEAPPAPAAEAPPEVNWADPFEVAMSHLREGRASQARTMLLGIAASDPSNPLVQSRIVEAESEIEVAARARGLRDEAKLRLGIPVNQLVGKKLAPPEAFLLSRFAAGPMQVGNLVMIAPFPPFEVLEILSRFLDDGTLKKSE